MADLSPQDSTFRQETAASTVSAEPRSFAPEGPDALTLLADDHREVERLIDAYGAAASLLDKVSIAERLCLALTIHAQIEEELFYPALRQAGVDRADLDECVVEHMTVRQLVTDLESAGVDDPLFDAKVRVLGEYVRAHVEEEEAQLFEAARANLDLSLLGQRLAARKAELCREAA
ncbi:MAG TPA: hemerythrin domain-containing protein, partial [Phenylobacterium sp.]